MNLRDRLQAELTPVLMVPPSGTLPEEPRADAHRYLVACDGIYLDVTRPWLKAVTRVAAAAVPLPFGAVAPLLYLACGPVPRELFDQFCALAKAALPAETSALIVWSASTRQFRLLPTAVHATAAAVQYRIPPLQRDEYRVIDIHSHARTEAFFSATDDQDDCHDVKLSVVIGNVDRTQISICARVCVMGVFTEIPRVFAMESLPVDADDGINLQKEGLC
ncbi:MAG: PRTRC system protein A [Betaproteobacteria bacterium]